MKGKRLISGVVALTIVLTCMTTVMRANALSIGDIPTFSEYRISYNSDNSVSEFLNSATNVENVDIFSDTAFNMNGRTYYEGVILNGHYGNENWCTASFNVENIDSLSFTLGHVDDANGDDGTLNIYLDNEYYETYNLSKDMNNENIEIDVSNNSVIRFNIANPGSYKEGTYGIADIIIEKSLIGDVNMDGKFTVTDVVLLQQWLLAVPDTHLANWKVADFYDDNKLNVFDLCLMKKALIEK